MSGIRPKGGVNLKSKYITRSNLHVISTKGSFTVKKAPVSKNAPKKETLVAANTKSPSKSSSLAQTNKVAVVKPDENITTHKELNLTNSDPIQPKKDIPISNQKPHSISNFLALSKKIPTRQEKKVSQDIPINNQKPHSISNFLALSKKIPTRQEKEVSHFKSNFLALQQVDKKVIKNNSGPSKKFTPIFKTETINKSPNTSAVQKVDKTIAKKASLQTNKLAAHEVKKKQNQIKKFASHEFEKPSQAKKFGVHPMFDPSFMPYHKQGKPEVKKKPFLNKHASAQRSKESMHYEMEFLAHKQGDKSKARPGASNKFEDRERRDFSHWEDERSLGSRMSFEKDAALRKDPRSSRTYLARDLEEEMYYKSKYGKSKNKKKDYKWKEREKYSSSSDHFSWYSNDYALKKKVPHSFEKYSEFPHGEGDFEEIEDYEEVASIEDKSKDSKVAVRFRKCTVRYLPYTTYSYFRPKWYYLSRKRYVVNCLYASAREAKISENKAEKAVSPSLKVTEGNKEVQDVIPDNEEMTEDLLVGNDDDDRMTEDVSVDHDEEVIEDVPSDYEKTIEDDTVVVDDEILTEDKPLDIDNKIITEDDPVDIDNEMVTEDELEIIDNEIISKDEPVVDDHEIITEDDPVDIDNEIISKDEPVVDDHEIITEDDPVDIDNEIVTEGELVIIDDEIITEDKSVVPEETTTKDEDAVKQKDAEEQRNAKDNDNSSKSIDLATSPKKVQTSPKTKSPLMQKIRSNYLAISPKKVPTSPKTKLPLMQKKTRTPEKGKSFAVVDLSADSQQQSATVNKDIKTLEIEIIDLEEETDLPENTETNVDQVDEMEHPNSKESTQSPKVFLKCTSGLELTSDIYQDAAAIQSSLSEWKSHLIGLEYILEIHDNTDETIVKKYHCGLCNEDLPFEKTAGQFVIDHIISYEHMCNYMAKHFPSSDYKFSKSTRSSINEIVLQTCCEEINLQLGYHYMCIVKDDYFQSEYDKIKEHFDSMKHWDETDMNINPTIIFNHLESDIRQDIKCVVDDMMNKILVSEEKKTFFTPQTIVSSSRRLNVKDKKKDMLKSIENTVSRCSTNTLIVLTPSPKVKLVKTPSSPSPDKKFPEKSAASSLTPKKSRESPRSFNLLQVPVHYTASQNLCTDMQSSTRNLPAVEEENLAEDAVHNSGFKNVSDTESAFKFNAKKAGSFRKYRVQDSASVPADQSENESVVRIVRIKTVPNRSIPLQSDSEEEEQEESVHQRGQLKKDASATEIDPLNEGSDNTGGGDILQGEDISDDDFSESEFVEIVSPGAEKNRSRSRSHNKQLHRKAMHSRYCHKRATWIKGNSSDKEFSSKDINLSGSGIPSIGNISKKYRSNFMKRADEYSQDIYASSSSKRKRSPTSSSSPSLDEFLRKLSPSPVRKRSKSPLRPYASFRKYGSGFRRHSKSPYRTHSRSPHSRHSRSPYKKRSRSPIKRRSSPYKRRSRSPIRKRSRSPFRKRSRSPIRKRSRSPFRKRSRTPPRRRSRSPCRRLSRSPRRKSSRSPNRRRSKSPMWSGSKGQARHKSRSPYRKPGGYRISRSPERAPVVLSFHKHSKSPIRQSRSPLSTYTHLKSPIRSDSRISEGSHKFSSDLPHKYTKDSARSSGSYESTSKLPLSHHHSASNVKKVETDLEEISDEDESKYFSPSETPKFSQVQEIIKNLPESARIMLVKVLQRFSITNINPNDPSFFELMKFVASNSSEIQRLMSQQDSCLPEVSIPVKDNLTGQSQDSFLHQYLLTGMQGHLTSLREAIPSTSGIQPGHTGVHFQQQPVPSMSGSQFNPSRANLLLNQFAQSTSQQSSPQLQYPVQSTYSAPLDVHPQQMFMNPLLAQQQQQLPHFQPDVYKAVSPQKPAMPPQPKVRSDVMFKDLKATVSKIFGGDDMLAKFGFKIPGFGAKPDNIKHSPTVPQMNPEPQTSVHGHRSKNINETSTRGRDVLPKSDGAYFIEAAQQELHVPPPDAKVSFCDVQRAPSQRNLFPVVNNPETTTNYNHGNSQISVNDAKKSLAQRLAAVLVKVGMTDVPAHLLQEMLMKIGAFSLNPPQDISEGEILGILRKLKYLS